MRPCSDPMPTYPLASRSNELLFGALDLYSGYRAATGQDKPCGGVVMVKHSRSGAYVADSLV